MGVGFQANVAHSKVGMFTLFYASGDRPEEEVLSQWSLGEGPCYSDKSTLEDRICVESVRVPALFEPMHPWTGGDFNPFMEHLDECPFLNPTQCQGLPPLPLPTASQQQQQPPMCPCACSPAWACAGTGFNYSAEFMRAEFPVRDSCAVQVFAQARVMDATDASHVCRGITRTRTSATHVCSLPRGLLGGYQGTPVTTEQLHSDQGVQPNTQQGSAAQVLLDTTSTTATSTSTNLWAGETQNAKLGAFALAMPRDRLHPAHVSFGLDTALSSMPLQVQSMHLLPSMSEAVMSTRPVTSWVPNLHLRWLAELEEHSVLELYPQLLPESRQDEAGSSWSCPIRKLVFWGSTTEGFGPITPNPVVAAQLYPNLTGIHPFIEPQGPYPRRADYYTPNGFCYYQTNSSSSSMPVIEVGSNIESQCSLLGTMRLLLSNAEVPITIQEPFQSRCNDIIDTPDAGGRLRSGETLEPAADLNAHCGLLHRLTPAIMSVQGDAVPVRPSAAGLTTASEGGDCHMGRAAVLQSGLPPLQGLQCATVEKTLDAVTLDCPPIVTLNQAGPSLSLPRARPLNLSQLMAPEKSTVVYQSDFMGWPQFIGPAGVPLAEAEVSFGQLYAPTLKETLSADLRANSGGLGTQQPWTGPDFWDRYVNGSLLLRTQQQQQQAPTTTTATAVLDAAIAAESEDAALWARPNWVWSFLSPHYKNATPVMGKGSLSQADWQTNRAQACNASMEAYLATVDASELAQGIRRIALCAPAPTGDLATLCTQMTQFSIDVAQANCQLVGQGDCIANLGMFYLPYMWSSTNQAYSYATVSAFYDRTLATLLPDSSVQTRQQMCSMQSDSLLAAMDNVARAQNDLCPATSIELLKHMLNDIRLAGDKLLHLAYTYTMMVVNFIAAAVSMGHGNASMYLDSATRYMMQMLAYVKEIFEMLLNVFTEMLMYISSVGRVFAIIIDGLCQAYNYTVTYFVGYVWCLFIRPCVTGILVVIRTLAFFDGNTVNALTRMLDVLGGGDPLACGKYYQTQMSLKCPFQQESQFNQSALHTQPMATLCWAQQAGGGAGIFSGISSDLLLSCTSSDTCALEPLRYDSGLVYCGSCPAAQVGGPFQFGCDVYLQRCVCGTQSYAKSECLSNADCAQQVGAQCGVASNLDALRSSFVSVACSACGGLSLSPVCMLDGQGASGVCGCANVADSLLTCSNLGARAMLGTTPQLCPVVVDPARQSFLANAPYPQAITLAFGDVAITYCHLSERINLCLNVRIPMGVSGSFEKAYVVLLSFLLAPGGGGQQQRRRQLLSVSSAGSPSSYLLREWIVAHPLQPQQQQGTRDEAKRRLYWAQLGAFTVHTFNLSLPGNHDPLTLFSSDTGIMLALPLLMPHMAADPVLMRFLVGHMPYGRTLLETTSTMSAFVSNLFFFTKPGKESTHPKQAAVEEEEEEEEEPLHLFHGRALLATESSSSSSNSRGDWNLNCTSVQLPVSKITDAFWDTVQYYERGMEKQANDENGTVPCDARQGLYNCLGYSLPPARARTPQDQQQSFWLEVLLFVPTMGVGPNRVVDALLSPIPHDEAEQKDLITGTRLLQDMGTCNFTRLMQGPVKVRSFMPMFLFLVLLFTVVSYTCLPLSFCTSLLWSFVFPIVLFWAMYNVSPLCWPMVPPRFVHDVRQEIDALIPTEVAVPKYLVQPHCTVAGKLSDGTYDPACFVSCAEPPFLFKSWQVKARAWFSFLLFLLLLSIIIIV